jgi:serine/threonine protein kinase
VTPLHWACLKAQASVVEALLAAHADTLLTACAGVFSGKSALDLASAESHSAEVSEALTSALGAALFEQRKVLGRGGFGTVIKAVRRDTKQQVALKAVRIGPQQATAEGGVTALRGARAERDILSKIRHPFVVQLHSAFQTRQHLYLVMDYCAGGDLGLHIRSGPYGRLPEPAACFVCAELLLAIEALHDAGVIHRDIKAENVLIDALGHVKIADLNAAKRDERLTSGGRTYTVVGTPFAAASIEAMQEVSAKSLTPGYHMTAEADSADPAEKPVLKSCIRGES